MSIEPPNERTQNVIDLSEDEVPSDMAGHRVVPGIPGRISTRATEPATAVTVYTVLIVGIVGLVGTIIPAILSINGTIVLSTASGIAYILTSGLSIASLMIGIYFISSRRALRGKAVASAHSLEESVSLHLDLGRSFDEAFSDVQYDRQRLLRIGDQRGAAQVSNILSHVIEIVRPMNAA